MKAHRIHIKMLLSLMLLITFGCCREKYTKVNLEPDDKRKIYSIAIDDMEEAEILYQELKLEILQIQNNRLYFFETKDRMRDRLLSSGYELVKADPMQIYSRVVRISKETVESPTDIEKRFGVQYIHSTRAYYIFRGTLSQLKSMNKSGIDLLVLEEELSPRVISIQVPGKADIQKVSELQVDIFNVEVQKDSSVIIYGQAFDYQIDKMISLNYTVQIQP